VIPRVLLLAFALSWALLAQPPRGFFPWWDRPVARDLNLSPAQTRQIRLTVREYRDKLIELRASLDKAEADLQDVFEDETVDQKRADAAIENLAHARENLTRAFAQMSLKLRMVLNQQQWKELQKRKEALDAEKKAMKKQP
jgi:Spy/CpxP family protein refolding chaperone